MREREREWERGGNVKTKNELERTIRIINREVDHFALLFNTFA